MLTKIREKTQGTFAWVILILICVPFALWGLQNYTEGGQERAVVIVGDKEFVQRDVNQAYAQFKQQYADMQVPEQILKTQAVEKLIRDELLLQHVVEENLTISDETVREFIASLQYFQRDGKFDKKQYESMLGAQGMSSAQFVNRIRKALLMEQYQKAVTETSFVSEQDIERFFKIQNQTRNIEYVTVKLESVTTEPSAEEINAYYQQQGSAFQTTEQLSVEYVELSLTSLMKDVIPTEEQIQVYYEDNIAIYSVRERRKISHILFAKTKDTTEEQALVNAQAAKLRLAQEPFATLATELSDDTVTAKTGGDLGLFEIGVMEPDFEKAAAALTLGEVSEPVKSAFGYHLITVTELVPAETSDLAEVKSEVTQAVQRVMAETTFYELGEILTEVSFESSDNLQVVSDELDLEIKQADFFTRNTGTGIASEEAVRNIAFSETVLQGNNSEPVELGDDRLLVLRLKEHQPAETKPLAEVRDIIIATIKTQQARQQTEQQAESIKQQLLAGASVEGIAQELALSVEKISALKRDSKDLSVQLNQAVFKAAKPIAGQPTVIVVGSPEGGQSVVSIIAVTDGVKTAEDAEKAELAFANIARALGQSDYAAVVDGMRVSTRVSIRE
ncbi:peptidylprolyl isomerase [Methylococcaceae bacterium CS1]|nr:SurA N-terminal domain-containing protein [Methyloprofundus sp.]TXK98795.1 peptidylprolyl isomerase [Methylococcaceae bacterium CS4]TXK99123.1 peptidylprolyl isomerase [Methylococcaceae bacterium CS5]TXL04754.1 peptidylprolyl isomerase [Methylococcaceae bacterium CS1]TXL06643.1 peptidylprolyl isomerase [Methylococcaceae bacterium CS3]TXL10774.1 peptidylprolyl isomerase [Methylococcaceae bacterium CS2]